MSSQPHELTVSPGKKVYLSADYHLLPDCDPKALMAWSQTFKKEDICIFLGDLYEAWVENHHQGRPGYENLHHIIKSITQRGVEVHLVVGNRDFLAGEACRLATGMTIHHGPLLLKSGEERLALFHGDELLPDDVGYLRYKAIVRNSVTLSLLKKLPLSFLMALAERTRTRSKAKLRNLPLDRFTPSLELIQAQLIRWKTKVAVAGHLHENIKIDGDDGFGCHVLSASSDDRIAFRRWHEGNLGDEEIFI